MQEEMDALIENNTWSPVPKPQNKQIINNKWIFKLKLDEEGNPLKYKARLVAKGYTQIKGFDYSDTYLPVVNIITIQTLLAIVNQRNIRLIQMNMTTAFLNGILEEELYMIQPDDQENSLVCKLHKLLYGLKQSSNCWNKRFNNFICQQDLARSKSDQCLYVKLNDDNNLYLLLYVDDVLMAGNSMKYPHGPIFFREKSNGKQRVRGDHDHPRHERWIEDDGQELAVYDDGE
ncbi:Reverse transcriptase, RNA-dependent DNA polymerase [Cinara cedri]|uniref:Reverse transcriptase, RNA-dependent DNA polymerase n=1 Tax=Cinara cedri TaxID=506608 RepID=A0A5E4MQ60_9HEMI|nr:Reverse transcriptase, RNA-dependent DNA polymerase [Cinara cedri]